MASLVIDLLMKTGQLETDAKRAEDIVKRRTKAMKASFVTMASEIKMLMGGVFAGIGVEQFVSKVVTIQREFDVLNASLITITGSQNQASQAFAWIKKFAADTPYSLAQVTSAFIKLKSLGLDASQSSLKSYGNTAAALGKDLNQLIEAVADATTGEFERLNEFGITAKQQGDKVSLTFQGLTKTIGNNAKEIAQYLTDLGNHNFADAMNRRMSTLDGALSNLGDSWDQLFLTISKQGIGDFIETQVRKASQALGDFDKIIQLLNAQNKTTGFNQAQPEGNWMTEVGQGAMAAWETITAAKDQAMAVSEGLGAAGNSFLRGNLEEAKIMLQMLDEDSAKIKKRLEDSLDAIIDFKTTNIPITKYDTTYPSSQTGVGGETPEQAKKRAEAEKERLKIMEEGKKVYDDTRTAAEKLAIEMDRLLKLKEAQAISEETYQRAIQETNDAINEPMRKEGEAVYEKTRTAAENLAIELEKLNKLKQQGFINEETYQRARTEAQNILNEDIENIKKREAEKQKAIKESRESLYAGLLGEEEAIRKSYEKRKEEILEFTQITEDERSDLMKRLNSKLQEDLAELDKDKKKGFWATWLEESEITLNSFDEMAASAAENFSTSFGDAFEKMIFDSESVGDALSTMAETMARSVINALGQMAAQWVAYQLVQKLMGSATATTAATAQTFNALSSQQMAALNSFASTAAIPVVGPAMAPAAAAAAIAATSPYVATIASLGAAAAAARATGGPVMGSTPYLVGERGAELFVPNTSGAIVPNDKLGGGNITVNLIENTKKAGTTEQKQTNGRRELDVFVADLLGDGPRSKAIQRSFGLQRRGY